MPMTEDNEDKITWEYWTFPNIPIYQTKLPQNVVDVLWGYIDKAKDVYKKTNVRFNGDLAGNINTSLHLEDEDTWFMRMVLAPLAEEYLNRQDAFFQQARTMTHSYNSLRLHKFWVNFQNKHEFNPIHNHGGVLSFVIWMKIPTHYSEQHALPLSANSNCKAASNFCFTYSDVLGAHQDYHINMSDVQEGWILVFPSQLRHMVYPFYECDEERVSISGNICYDSKLYNP